MAASLAVAASFVLPQARAGAGSALRPAILNVTGWSVQAAGAPTPNAADGIGPGSYLLITRSDGTFICTANFVWKGGGTQYLGAAGHCFLKSTENSLADGNPVSRVQVCTSNCFFGGQLGAVVRGTFANLGGVAYARQNDPSAAAPTDIGHDFGLVAIPSGLSSQVRTAVPVWGGPNASSAPVSPGDPLCVYGNGVGLGETFATRARAGVAEAQQAGAWYAALPASPGDSGSGVVNCASGKGAGILTHLVVGVPGGTAGTTVLQAISMAASGGLSITLA
jgi:hypothetical protein